jgi:hypothetical protein
LVYQLHEVFYSLVYILIFHNFNLVLSHSQYKYYTKIIIKSQALFLYNHQVAYLA